MNALIPATKVLAIIVKQIFNKNVSAANKKDLSSVEAKEFTVEKFVIKYQTAENIPALKFAMKENANHVRNSPQNLSSVLAVEIQLKNLQVNLENYAQTLSLLVELSVKSFYLVESINAQRNAILRHVNYASSQWLKSVSAVKIKGSLLVIK